MHKSYAEVIYENESQVYPSPDFYGILHNSDSSLGRDLYGKIDDQCLRFTLYKSRSLVSLRQPFRFEIFKELFSGSLGVKDVDFDCNIDHPVHSEDSPEVITINHIKCTEDKFEGITCTLDGFKLIKGTDYYSDHNPTCCCCGKVRPEFMIVNAADYQYFHTSCFKFIQGIYEVLRSVLSDFFASRYI